MSEHKLEKLLGGFAADTLTSEERQQLYRAALQDQQLFNALADEQALKELLADASVRRRLLQALNQPGTAGAGSSTSWLDWFRRPANLALAGGLAGAVFAVVLGTKVYQDSLKEASHTNATEDAAPLTAPAPIAPAPQPELPQATAPPAKPKQVPAAPPARDFATDKLSKREQSSALKHFEEQRSPDALQSTPLSPLESDRSTTKTDSPIGQAPQAMNDQPAAKEGKATTLPPLAAAAPQVPAATSSPAGATATRPSARSLFYGEAARMDTGLAAQEPEHTRAPFGKSMPQLGRLERRKESTDRMESTAGAVRPLKPLGLRYALITRGSDGIEQPVTDRAATLKSDSVRLVLEANQDSFLQVWNVGEATGPLLLFPDKDSGRISVKIADGQRVEVSFPPDTTALSLRLAHAPFGPIAKQEALLLDRPSPSQIQESVPSEHATYVVNLDPSAGAQLMLHIQLVR